MGLVITSIILTILTVAGVFIYCIIDEAAE